MSLVDLLETSVHKAFFEALRSGLWGRRPDPAAFQSLSRDEWSRLYKLSTLQTVEGIVCEGIQQLSPEVLPPKDILAKWMVRLQHIEERNGWMNEVLSDQIAFFEKHNLHPFLQKGQGVARYYRRPQSRVCGDIDWCFSDKKEYNRAAALMKKHGQGLKIGHGYSLSYTWKGCDIEHHQRLVELRNPFVQGYLKGLSRSTSYPPVPVEFGEQVAYIPHPILNILLVNAHILKHLVVYGIGTRQLCDAARLYDALHNQFDPNALRVVYERTGILKWSYVLHELLVNYIGLDRKKLPFEQEAPEDAAWMMADILKGGNFGFYNTEGKDETKSLDKPARVKKFFSRFYRYARLAPGETISSPFMIMFSKIDH